MVVIHETHKLYEEDDGFEDIADSYRYVSGRRFHNTTSKYSLPNDKVEVSRLDLSHDLFKYAFDGNFSSPIKNILSDGITVLDIGCGTGRWTIENAIEYPKSTFVGVDMSSIFPRVDRPQNAGFIECNVLDGLPFPSNTFDFVHQRLLHSAFTEEQWIKVIEEIVRVLKPSGYIEFMELNSLTFNNSGPITRKVMELVKQFYKSKGLCLDLSVKLKEFLESERHLGKVNIEERMIPIGKWQGIFGKLMLEYIRMSFESYAVILNKKFKYNNQEYLDLIERFTREIEEYRSCLTYTRFYVQKI